MVFLGPSFDLVLGSSQGRKLIAGCGCRVTLNQWFLWHPVQAMGNCVPKVTFRAAGLCSSKLTLHRTDSRCVLVITVANSCLRSSEVVQALESLTHQISPMPFANVLLSHTPFWDHYILKCWGGGEGGKKKGKVKDTASELIAQTLIRIEATNT